MTLYFSNRAVAEIFDNPLYEAVAEQSDEVGGSSGFNAGAIAATLNGKQRKYRSDADMVRKCAKVKKKRWVEPRDASVGDIIDVKLCDVSLGLHKTLDAIPGVFLLSGTVCSGEISFPIQTIAVGSPDNYVRFNGKIEIPKTGWYPSIAEGRAHLYAKEGLVAPSNSGLANSPSSGQQWDDFSRIMHLLEEARYAGDAGFPQRYDHARIQAVVEDRRDYPDASGRTMEAGLLLRLILVDI